MMQHHPTRSQQGFTLIETVIVILLLSITSAAIISMNSGLFNNAQNIRSLQSNSQLLQVCAEHVMEKRRLSGFVDAPNYDAECEALPVVPANSNTFSVTTALNYTGSSCPSGATCQQVDIQVNSTSGSVGPMSLLLVKY
jgi:prepilin-type N-terminal cleavage/methylation domain-containing protein